MTAAPIMRRALWGALVIWVTVTATFAVQNLLPSDPARMVAGAQARPEDVARVRAQLGLDQPLTSQYARFLGRLAHLGSGEPEAHRTCAALGPIHFDLGRSYQQRRPVVELIAARLPRTLTLGAAALTIQLTVGVALGLMAAWRARTAVDAVTSAASLLTVSVPTFVSGVALQWLFAHRLGWLPLDGYGKTTGEQLASMVLPAMTLGLYGSAVYVRITRDELIDELGRDYARTARAKGASSLRTACVHALRNAALPIATLAGLDLGALVGGAIVTETLFRWPGIGALSVEATLDRDGPVVMGVVLVTSIAVVVATLLTDALALLLDPRARRPSR